MSLATNILHSHHFISHLYRFITIRIMPGIKLVDANFDKQLIVVGYII